MTEHPTVKKERRSWHGRGLTSFLVTLIFITLAFTGLVLSMAPSCREARESGWTVLLLTKDQLSALHAIMGGAFLVIVPFHIYFNWTILMRYIVRKKKLHLKKEAIIALLLFFLLMLGGIFELPPFGDTEEQKAQSCCEEEEAVPSLGHGVGIGRFTLEELCTEAGLSLEEVTHFLEEEGLTVSPENTLRELAEQKQMAPVDFKEFLVNEKTKTN